MKKTFILILAAGAMSMTGAFAQNLNPHVVVTNEYEGKLLEITKKNVPMAVPDSLLKFNYDIDYSVFSNPYNGSYEFHPYLVEMRPEASAYDGKVFYANVGAGYSLHPEADVVWTPLKTEKFYLGVYDCFRGFVGNYTNLNFDGTHQKKWVSNDKGGMYSGRHLTNRLGVEGTLVGKKTIFSFDAGYAFMNSADTLDNHMVNGGDLALRLRSNDNERPRFFYDFTLSGKCLYDDYQSFTLDNLKTYKEVGGRLAGNVGMRHGIHQKLNIDLAAGVLYTGESFGGDFFETYITPQYIFDYDKFRCKLGAKLSFVTTGSKQLVYPDISIDYFLGKKKVSLYATVTGGDKLNGYSEYLRLNPFMNNMFYSDLVGYSSGVFVSAERFNARAGIKGSAGAHFQFDAHAGYVMKVDDLCESLFINMDGGLQAYFSRNSYNAFNAGVDLFWNSGQFDLEGHFNYTDVNAVRKGCEMIAPAAFDGSLVATYNINRRIFFGVDLISQSERTGNCRTAFNSVVETTIPWYLDLGVHAEFVVNRWLSAWAKGANLLGQPIQKYLLHSEQGPYFVAGISVRL